MDESERKRRLASLTPEQRKALLRKLAAKAAARPDDIPRASPEGGLYPLSFAQQRMWFLQQLDPAQVHYVNTVWVKIEGALDAGRLRASVNAIVARHEGLRTVFVERDGEAWQRPLPRLELDVPELDFGHLDESEQFAASEAAARAQGREGFDLGRGPLLRLCLHRLGARPPRLIIAYHHIVADTWSLEAFVREFLALYERPDAPALPALPVTYADFAAWQRATARERFGEQLAYWERALKRAGGDDPPLELPTDRPRPPQQSFRGAQRPFAVPAEVGRAAREVARAAGATPFAVLLAAFQVLLSRYARDPAPVVGVPVLGRTHPQLKNVIGFFVNTLALKTRVHEDAPFLELVGAVSEASAAALAHQDVPFDAVVERLNPRRSLSHAPVFQVMFSYENVPEASRQAGGLALTSGKVGHGTAIFDLVLSVHDAGAALTGDVSYATDLFDAATIEFVIGHYLTLLGALTADPRAPIAAAPHTPPSELALLRRVGQRPAPSPFGARDFAELFAQNARRAPDATAVRDRGVAYTYGQLAASVAALAAELDARGARAGDLVALALPRGAAMLTGMLAAFEVGAAFLPLDPALPNQRLGRLITRAGASVVLGREGDVDRLAALAPDASVVPSVAAGRSPDGPGLGRPRPTMPGRQLAYVLFTSGSTGEPKGAMVEQGSMMNHLGAKARHFNVGPGDVMAQTAPQSFDIFVWQTLVALAVGGQVAFFGDDEVRDPESLLRGLAERGVTLFQAVPSHLGALLDELDAPGGPAGRPDLARVRTVSVGGEAVSPALCARFFRHFPGAKLVNCYGPTECADDVTHHDVAHVESGRMPIGRPVDNAELHVVDARLRPVGVGVVGELLVGGVPVGRGYVNDPARTAAAFVPDPFGARPGGRLYRTGDLARFRPDGVLEFFGRTDHQVKVRGYRIELEEIDATLASHPRVRAAAAVVVGAEAPRLAAFYVPEGESPIGADELKAHLAERLPAYMVPADLVAMAALPLTANGKVDRAELACRPPRPAPAAAPDAPRTPAEVALVEACRAVLGVEHAGVGDNFFDLGGDSIVSLRVIARLRQRGYRLRAKDVFRLDTLAELAAAMEPLGAASAGAWSGDDVPLSPIQAWFFAQHFANEAHWNQGVVLRLAGPVDPDELATALAAVVNAHPQLRARFRRESDRVRQWVEPPVEAVPVVLLGPALAGAEAEAWAPLHAGVDLERGPVFRAGLRPAEDGGYDLGLVAHHLVIDGVSWHVVVDDLSDALIALRAGRRPEPFPETTPFGAWSEALAAFACAPAFEPERAHWLAAHARAAAAPPWPSDLPAGGNTEASRATHEFSFDRRKTERLLGSLTEVFRASAEVGLAAAVAHALCAWLGRSDVTLWMESHGREGADELGEGLDTGRTVGWFTALYPVTVEPGGEGAAGSLRATKGALRAVPRRGAGYLLASPGLDALRPEVTFNYLGRLDVPLPEVSPVRSVTPMRHGTRAPEGCRTQELDVSSYLARGELHVLVSYGAERHTAASVAALADAIAGALDALGADPEAETAGPEGALAPGDFGIEGLSAADLAGLAEHLRGRGLA
ncbi:MAG: amino acid adenylation domain-containing protein [Polyangiaceae bacterium]|nr:amino acid adenylation domain-containing protein [Polyangiaceae bacterium]